MSPGRTNPDDELVFLPLGGSGEIGMNLNLYGYGPGDEKTWIMLDCGVMFGHEGEPGVDVMMPDIGFIAERRRDLLGIVLTHAHEDHLGAVAHLWPKLRCPVFATPFTAAMLRDKLIEAGIFGEVPLKTVAMGSDLSLGPFALRLITLTHSIPEPNAVAIETPLGTVVHTGDWKIDPDPLIGEVTDSEALRALGDRGVLAVVCDSTNALVPGRSGSEAEVRGNLVEALRGLTGKVAVTSFASNVARLQSIAQAAAQVGRSVCLVGRSMHRVTTAARETGYLRDLPEFVPEEQAGYLPAEATLFLCTGSQGEPRAALARIARGDHPHIAMGEGDTVIFSSRVIPGNEKAIFQLQNDLAARGVAILTERDHDVHVSGHPCRDELADMYGWLRPQIAVPVHGELRHMVEHARLARELQVPQAIVPANGDVIRLAPGSPAKIDEAPAGRLHLDGRILCHEADGFAAARRGLAFAGHIAVTLVLDGRGRVLAEPVVVGEGVPEDVLDAVFDAADSAARGLKGGKRSDEELEEMIRRACRKAAQAVWGKRPMLSAAIVRV